MEFISPYQTGVVDTFNTFCWKSYHVPSSEKKMKKNRLHFAKLLRKFNAALLRDTGHIVKLLFNIVSLRHLSAQRHSTGILHLFKIIHANHTINCGLHIFKDVVLYALYVH